MRTFFQLVLIPFLLVAGLACAKRVATTRQSAMAETMPATIPATQPTGPDIMRRVLAGERWIDTVRSFHAVFDDNWVNTPYGLEVRRAAALKESRGKPVDPKRDASLWSTISGRYEVAFDEHRWRTLQAGGNFDFLSIWNGQFRSGYENYPLNNQNTFYFNNDRTTESFWINLQWPRAGRHTFWFDKKPDPARDDPDDKPDTSTDEQIADECELIGRRAYRGTDCYVIVRRHNPYPARRLFVGVADGRLRGVDYRAVIPKDLAAAHWADLGRKFGGPTDEEGLMKWDEKQPPSVSGPLWRELYYQEACRGLTIGENWVDDYREVAPGKWFPMRQGYEFREYPVDAHGNIAITSAEATTRPYVTSARELRATAVEVDVPLNDALFSSPPIPDGVRVVDARRTPVLSYKAKHDRTAAEWKKIADDADAQQAMFDKMARDQAAALAKAPPAFADGRWYNTPAMTWADLKGKVVLIDCFAHWCAPCRNDYPHVVAMNGGKPANLVILGLHTASGFNDAAVRKLIDEEKLTYPIYVDTYDTAKGAGEKDSGFGRMFKALGCSAIPHAFVIGVDGKVAAHGSLGEMSAKARELARAATSRPAQ